MGAVELFIRALHRHEDETQRLAALVRWCRSPHRPAVHAGDRPGAGVVVVSGPDVTELHGREGLAAWAAACPDFEPAVRALVEGEGL